jgi:hypothetical protein
MCKTKGLDRSLPGYSRYTVVGRPGKGEHNLKIERVNLDDDAEFECQVAPTKDHPGLRAKAYLNVLSTYPPQPKASGVLTLSINSTNNKVLSLPVPPRTVEILGHQDGSLLEIRNGEQVQLVCIAREAKPQASIRWLRNGVSLNLGEYRVYIYSRRTACD